MVFVLNKVDLVPTWATKRWVKVLSREYPTLAFHASITNPFGKGALIQLLRQFSQLHSELKQVSVGFVGYPNVGKSSIINTLRKKVVSDSLFSPSSACVYIIIFVPTICFNINQTFPDRLKFIDELIPLPDFHEGKNY